MTSSQDALDYISKLEFEKGKSYLVLIDPHMVDFEALSRLPAMDDDYDVTFVPARPIPGKPISNSLNQISFESRKALIDYLSSEEPYASSQF